MKLHRQKRNCRGKSEKSLRLLGECGNPAGMIARHSWFGGVPSLAPIRTIAVHRIVAGCFVCRIDLIQAAESSLAAMAGCQERMVLAVFLCATGRA